MELDLFNQKGEKLGKIELDDKIFDGEVNMALLHQAIYCYTANLKSQRLASSKNRGQVRGSGRKPWRQKGTGRARAGERRSIIWRGGGVAFGPKPRRVYKKLPYKMKLLSLKSALNAKLRDRQLILIEALKIDTSRTREFEKIVKNLDLERKTLFVDKEFSSQVKLSVRNLEKVQLERADNLNAYTTLNCNNLVLTQQGLKRLQQRLSKVVLNKKKIREN